MDLYLKLEYFETDYNYLVTHRSRDLQYLVNVQSENQVIYPFLLIILLCQILHNKYS